MRTIPNQVLRELLLLTKCEWRRFIVLETVCAHRAGCWQIVYPFHRHRTDQKVFSQFLKKENRILKHSLKHYLTKLRIDEMRNEQIFPVIRSFVRYDPPRGLYVCASTYLLLTYTHFIQQKSKSTFPKSPKKNYYSMVNIYMQYEIPMRYDFDV